MDVPSQQVAKLQNVVTSYNITTGFLTELSQAGKGHPISERTA